MKIVNRLKAELGTCCKKLAWFLLPADWPDFQVFASLFRLVDMTGELVGVWGVLHDLELVSFGIMEIGRAHV